MEFKSGSTLTPPIALCAALSLLQGEGEGFCVRRFRGDDNFCYCASKIK